MASLLAGAVPALAFPAPGLWWLAWVGLVPLLVLVRSAPSAREAGVRGWLGGAGFLLAVHHWLLPLVHVFFPLIVALMGLLWLPFGRLAWRLLREPVTVGRLIASLTLLPSGWLAIELVRSVEWLGGPWGLLGTSQWQVPQVLAVAGLGGAWLLSVLIVVVNVAVVVGCSRQTAPRVRGTAMGAIVLVIAAVLGWSAAWPGPEIGGTIRVVAVQPGIVLDKTARFDRQEELTRRVAGQDADLVVWGESGVGFSLFEREDLQERLASLSRVVGAPLLVNVDARRSGGGIYKTAVAIDDEGIVGSYAKTRLVPFGEYLPFRPALQWLGAVTKVAPEDRYRGPGPVVLRPEGLPVGPLVCFESAFPDLTRSMVRLGARLIVVQSSTWTFQDSWAPDQHASLAAVRAAESGVPVVHATLTGTTAAFDARGQRVAGPLGTDESGLLWAELPLGSGRTPYTALGAWTPLLAVATLVAATALRWLGARRRRTDRLASVR